MHIAVHLPSSIVELAMATRSHNALTPRETNAEQSKPRKRAWRGGGEIASLQDQYNPLNNASTAQRKQSKRKAR